MLIDQSERHRRMIEVLKARSFASVRDLQVVVNASQATIRRDIATLHELGLVRKVHGGIAAADSLSENDHPSSRSFIENQMLGVASKTAIAAAAAKLVHDGDALIIHGGSTCYLFAQHLAHRNVRIYTNSMPLAAKLWLNGTCHLTLSGGDLYREPGIVFSPTAGPPEFFASKFFLGAQAITHAGMHESHPLIVRETKLLLQCADEVIVLADSGKFDLGARHLMMPLTRINTLITDDGLSDGNHRMLSEAGIRIIVAATQKDEVQGP